MIFFYLILTFYFQIWLKKLEQEMRSSLKSYLVNCVSLNSQRDQDMFSMPVQILCLAQNIRFTEQVERAIVSRELQKLKANIEKESANYAGIDLDEERDKLKRQALILQCVYYLTIIQQLIDKNTTTCKNWLWQKQLRY